jgi:hypothetical protein
MMSFNQSGGAVGFCLDCLSGRFIQVSDDLEQMLLQVDRVVGDDLYALRLPSL